MKSPGAAAPTADQQTADAQDLALADDLATAPQATTRRSPLAPRRARLLAHLATALVTIAFSYIALKGIQLSKVWSALRTSDYWWLLPALVVFGVATIVRGLRWRSLFARDRRPSRGAVIDAMFVGYLFNSILPARAGEAARIVVLSQRGDRPAAEVVGTVVLERIYDVLAILVIFFAAEPALPHVSWFGAAALAALLLALGLAAAAIVLAVYGDRPLRVLLAPMRRIPRLSGDRLDRTVEELVQGLSGLRDRRVALEAFAWTILAWLLSALSAWLLMRCFPLHLPLAGGVLVTVAIGLGMILPSPPAAVGVFEGAALIGLSAYGVSHNAALPYALVLHVLNVLPFIVVGGLFVWHNARHPRRRTTPEPVATPS